MPTFKFAPNVPATVDVKYIDIVPSEKGDSQVRFKGTIDGKEKMFAYLPGKLTANLATLIAAGVIAAGQYPEDVSEPVEVKPLKRQFTAVSELLPPAKYGTFKIVGANGASAAVPAATSNGAVAAGASPGPPKSFQDIYASATKFVIDQIVPKYATAKFEVTTADVREMVRDLFTAKLKES